MITVAVPAEIRVRTGAPWLPQELLPIINMLLGSRFGFQRGSSGFPRSTGLTFGKLGEEIVLDVASGVSGFLNAAG